MITIFDWFGYELSTKKRYSLIKEAGFDGVLMWWSSGFGRGAYKHAPEIARQEGLFIENIHGPVMNQHALSWKPWTDIMYMQRTFSALRTALILVFQHLFFIYQVMIIQSIQLDLTG